MDSQSLVRKRLVRMDTAAPERTLLGGPAAAAVFLRSWPSQHDKGFGPGRHRRQHNRWRDRKNADCVVARAGTPRPGLQAGHREPRLRRQPVRNIDARGSRYRCIRRR